MYLTSESTKTLVHAYVTCRLDNCIKLVAPRVTGVYYRKIHYLTREFHVKLHAKTDIARIA